MNKSNTIIALIIVILSTCLLVGNRIGFTWAGGEGLEKHSSALVIIDGAIPYTEIQRGETLSSADLDTLNFILNNTEIFLDKNTEVKLIDGRKGKEKINVIQGRVVVRGEISIETRAVETFVNGTTSFTHYSWLDEIEISPISGSVSVVFGDKEIDINSPIKLHTLPTYEMEQIDFNPENSSAKEFYEKVL